MQLFEPSKDSAGIYDEEEVFARGKVLYGIRSFGDDGFRVLPIRLLHARPDDLEPRSPGMSNSVDVFLVERQILQVVRRGTEYAPFRVGPFHLRNGRVKHPQFSLCRRSGTQDVAREGLIDRSAWNFFG